MLPLAWSSMTPKLRSWSSVISLGKSPRKSYLKPSSLNRSLCLSAILVRLAAVVSSTSPQMSHSTTWPLKALAKHLSQVPLSNLACSSFSWPCMDLSGAFFGYVSFPWLFGAAPSPSPPSAAFAAPRGGTWKGCSFGPHLGAGGFVDGFTKCAFGRAAGIALGSPSVSRWKRSVFSSFM